MKMNTFKSEVIVLGLKRVIFHLKAGSVTASSGGGEGSRGLFQAKRSNLAQG